MRFLTPIFDHGHATVASFPSRFPILPLDRVMGYPKDIVTAVEVHDSPLARIASDHLPIKAYIDLSLAAAARETPEERRDEIEAAVGPLPDGPAAHETDA